MFLKRKCFREKGKMHQLAFVGEEAAVPSRKPSQQEQSAESRRVSERTQNQLARTQMLLIKKQKAKP